MNPKEDVQITKKGAVGAMAGDNNSEPGRYAFPDFSKLEKVQDILDTNR